MDKYRIHEFCGVFTIEVRGYEEKGILWWKRKEWSWYKSNFYGEVIQTWPVIQPLCRSFTTLESAQKRVKGFKKGSTYHYDQYP